MSSWKADHASDRRHQLFPHVLLPLGLYAPIFAVWPSTFPLLIISHQTRQAGKPPGSWICPIVSERDGGHLICPACVTCRNTLRQPHRWHDAAAAPLHSLPRRNACATAPPCRPKQSTARSQPLQTIKYAPKKTGAQLAPLVILPFWNHWLQVQTTALKFS